MYKFKSYQYGIALGICLTVAGCKAPAPEAAITTSTPVPESFGTTAQAQDANNNTAALNWKDYFKDQNLIDLIDIALKNNQELNITLQEIEIAKNDIRVRKGLLLPTVGVRAGAGIEKVGRYTSQGAGDATTEIKPGVETPDPLGDFTISAYANWEVDIWKKLRNSKKAALNRYLATVEGRNFVITNLIAEVADSYYELIALDNQLDIVKQTIKLQTNALEIVKVQKQAARATELGVKKFEAEVLTSQSMEFDILQQIKEAENKINFLLGRYPQEIKRTSNTNFLSLLPAAVSSGIPSQLLANRPDVKQAELELVAAKLDVKVARAEFYPSLDISAAIGVQAFKPSYLLTMPESLLYSLAGDLVAPLINRNAIKAEFASANARQLQALYNYDRTVLNAYLEVSNQLSKIDNLQKGYDLKSKQVEALNTSIDVSNDLFKSARVDYFEVLMTQRDALEAKLELVDTKKEQLNAAVHVYRDLGGGWK
ncbi:MULTISPECIES: TolC family protein [unclassified Flavobacterium]|uniref:TolC family protein n=1 Tax=unclassified Flavobacterium TaxID=196869 RepID=UPI00070D7252|nr:MULTISPECIES: TolC family protein [unclassified Flavobacterium]KRD61753.1 RND transporter [Flavobacterium sp. Root935]MDQ1166986.1 NodT family efflux transporter outer membrane factor (OMF) lipoprotein [Flavobacterium sp. SORGH_AS_0622]TDX12369.1 NodT family efflux transporter outer membrane factor (OMF) lipoprotein [Flavobacterium sp. S87F.05.LMB.W.Kidney.N]BDU27449.1 RND transporter [Flavobacterium sp. GSB-24]